jgi:hypothetical protein
MPDEDRRSALSGTLVPRAGAHPASASDALATPSRNLCAHRHSGSPGIGFYLPVFAMRCIDRHHFVTQGVVHENVRRK